MKTWTFRYRDRISGKVERKTLGRFPDVMLARARDLADADRVAMQTGASPQELVRQARRAERTAILFGTLADRYLEEVVRPNKGASTHAAERSYLVSARSEWAERKAKDITRQDIIDFLDRRAKVAPIGANRTRTVLAALFGFAVDKALLEMTPVVKIAKPTKRERAKDRVLSDEEIRILWRALDGVDPPLAAGLRVLLLTGQRPGQVTAMDAGELHDLQGAKKATWHIPIEKRKDTRANKRGPHVVPLSVMASEIIKTVIASKREHDKSSWVFWSYRNPGNALDRHSLSRALQRVLANLQSDDPNETKIIEGLRADRPTPHDFRRTCATQMAALGVAREDRMAVLDHSEGDVHDAHYDRYDRLREKRIALEKWARRLQHVLVGSAHLDNVIELQGSRR
ncbi:MAG: site-specific integrase [Methylobacteriaceae bacterium]|nr:site-specific integrase [Methylobacteriaceae bacterium]